MPSSTKKQARFMAAAAHNPKFAKKAGIKSSVAKDFNKADAGTGILKKAKGGKVTSLLKSPSLYEIEHWHPDTDRSYLFKTKAQNESEAMEKFNAKYPDRADWDHETVNLDAIRAALNETPLKKARGGRISAMPQNPLDIAAASTRAPTARMAPKAGLRTPASPVAGLLRHSDQLTHHAGSQLAGFAGGGKVGMLEGAMGRLQKLADQFKAALDMEDKATAARIGRQMESMQPGSSQKVLDSINQGQATVAGNKLQTFAKGGKVKQAVEAAKKATNVEFVRSVSQHDGDFDRTASKPWSKKEMQSNIADLLEEAGHPRAHAQHFDMVEKPSFLEFDSNNPGHAGAYFDAKIQGPPHLVDAIDKLSE